MQSDQFRSATYWENRYESGRTSGPGSQSVLAAYKAGFLNSFVASNHVTSVVEFGCGDGGQLSLAHYPTYVGLDVSRTAIRLCKSRYADDKTKSFFRIKSSGSNRRVIPPGELGLSLDVIFHLVEDDVYQEYMHRLFSSSRRYVVIYSSNREGVEVKPAQHVRHRRFTDWVATNHMKWRLAFRELNPFPFDPSNPTLTSFADFFVYERRPIFRF